MAPQKDRARDINPAGCTTLLAAVGREPGKLLRTLRQATLMYEYINGINTHHVHALQGLPCLLAPFPPVCRKIEWKLGSQLPGWGSRRPSTRQRCRRSTANTCQQKRTEKRRFPEAQESGTLQEQEQSVTSTKQGFTNETEWETGGLACSGHHKRTELVNKGGQVWRSLLKTTMKWEESLLNRTEYNRKGRQ